MSGQRIAGVHTTSGMELLDLQRRYISMCLCIYVHVSHAVFRNCQLLSESYWSHSAILVICRVHIGILDI